MSFVFYFPRKPNLSGNSPCEENWRSTNYCIALAFRQPVSSLALQAETLQLVANTSPREWQFYLALQHFYFFFKSQYLKITKLREFPLCTAVRFLLPMHLLQKPCLFSRTRAVLLTDFGSSCCYAVAAACLIPACAAPSLFDSSSLNTGKFFLNNLNHSEMQLLTPAGVWNLGEIPQHRESWRVG